MPETLKLTIEVENDVEAYFAVNKLNTLMKLENIEVTQAIYKGKTYNFATVAQRRDFLKEE